MPKKAESLSPTVVEAAPKRIEVRLSGSGGQGIILAATLLADASAQSGRQVVQTQSYGPEARGGASKAEVVISESEVDYPEVATPDVTLCLSQAAFDKYASEAPAGSLLYYDSGLVTPSAVTAAALIGGPFAQLAMQKLGKSVVTNIIALAALSSDAGLIDAASLRDALKRRVPARFLELNLKAFELGWGCDLSRQSG